MENNLHIELLAKAIYDNQLITTLSMEDIKEFIEVDKKGMLPSMALTALQALETALTEKHRAEVEGLKRENKRLNAKLDKDYKGYKFGKEERK